MCLCFLRIRHICVCVSFNKLTCKCTHTLVSEYALIYSRDDFNDKISFILDSVSNLSSDPALSFHSLQLGDQQQIETAIP